VPKLSALIANFETRWPLSDAEDWDRPGLMLGALDQSVSKVLLCVDVTSEVLDEAIQLGVNLVFSHHPMFLRGVHDLAETGFRGKLVARAIREGIAVYSAHTNADGADDGVTDGLAKALGLEELSSFGPTTKHGRVGELRNPEKLIDFARKISRKIPSTASGIRVSGDPEQQVKKIAVMGGAGDSYLSLVRELDVDVFITSDLRHHPAQDFKAQSAIEPRATALIDISHWAAEWVWLDNLAAGLSKDFSDVQFMVSEVRTDPWDFAVMQ
jgi:dinuclear metal center YbgI/SA1388 family protein